MLSSLYHIANIFFALMRYIVKRLLFLIAVLLITVGCRQPGRDRFHRWLEENDKLKVLCTTAFVGELVQAVGGADLNVILLIPHQSDPHSYQLVKGDDEKFRRADCIFYSGLNLEHRGALARYLSSHNAVSVTTKLTTDEIIMDGVTVDPHVWLDLSLWSKGVDCIVETLSKKKTEHQNLYKENGKRVKESLLFLHKKIYSLLQAVPNERRYLVTTHNAYQYFSRAYLATQEEKVSGEWKRRCMAPEGLAPESQINTRDLYAVVEYILEHKTPIVFAEYGMNRDSLEKVVASARSRGCEISIAKESLYSDSIPGSMVSDEQMTHEEMLEHNARVIIEGLNR